MLDVRKHCRQQTPNCGSYSSSLGNIHRPLGTPASDVSMYYDKNFFPPPTRQSRSRKNCKRGKETDHAAGRGRPATTIPCISRGKKYDDNSLRNRRSWPQLGGVDEAWQPVVALPISTNQRQLVSPQLSTYTVGDQRHKVGINNRPHTHDIASLPSFRTEQQSSQPGVEHLFSRPHSEQTMCKLPSVRKITNSAQQQQELRFASNGLRERHSTYRSLASNPNLRVEAIQGRVKITRRRRPKSLPSELQEMQLCSPREETVTLTGFHRRSKSPTFTTLKQTKEYLDAALSRKLWEIRRQIDGQRARENSAVLSEVSSTKPDNHEDWYERMLREHTDEDLAAIETLCIVNHDDQLDSTESLSLKVSKPQVDLRFDKRYVKAHINDWNILALMAEEEKKRNERELRKLRRNAGRPPPVASVTPRTRNVQEKVAPPKKAPQRRKQPEPVFLPTPKPNIEKPITIPEVEDEVLTLAKDNDSLEESPESPVSHDNEDLVEENTKEDLVAKYLSNRKPIEDEPVIEEQSQDIPQENTEELESDSQESSEQLDVAEKKLTEKDKFLLMRKRMEDRKAEKEKKRERFSEYSGSIRGVTGNNGAKQSLGTLMSSRLEKIATYKSGRKSMMSDDDDDDDDEDDDDYEDDDDDDNDDDKY